jgi:hypothetical protein
VDCTRDRPRTSRNVGPLIHCRCRVPEGAIWLLDGPGTRSTVATWWQLNPRKRRTLPASVTDFDLKARRRSIWNERFSESAEAVLRRAGQIPYTAPHQLEVPNAFERLVGRDLMTRECDSVQQQLQDILIASD